MAHLEIHHNSAYVVDSFGNCLLEEYPDMTQVVCDQENYEILVDETAIYPESGTGSLQALTYAVLGLAGEAGEVADKLKKVIRGDKTLDEAKEGLAAELGDVLWYVHRVTVELGRDLETIRAQNALKLLSRKSRNVLQGSGDNR